MNWNIPNIEHWTFWIANSDLLFVWCCVSLWHVVWQKRYHVHVHIILLCYSVCVDMRCLLLQNIKYSNNNNDNSGSNKMLKTGKTRLHIAHETNKSPNWQSSTEQHWIITGAKRENTEIQNVKLIRYGDSPDILYTYYVFTLLSRRHPYTLTFTIGDTQKSDTKPNKTKTKWTNNNNTNN